MAPDYSTNAEQGYCGDWRRGAPLGRPISWDVEDRAAFHGRLTLRRIRLDSGGYDPQGAYFGHGAPLYWYASEDGLIDAVLRANTRGAAKAAIRQDFPNARFHR